ncbi:hypothetical protein ACWPKO_18970 (plasmid) [Coraliomargarita sp. W4R53]
MIWRRYRSTLGWVIATSAAIGSALVWGAFGVVIAMTGGAGYSYIFIGVAVVAAVFTAVLARIMLGRVERRHDTYP